MLDQKGIVSQGEIVCQSNTYVRLVNGTLKEIEQEMRTMCKIEEVNLSRDKIDLLVDHLRTWTSGTTAKCASCTQYLEIKFANFTSYINWINTYLEKNVISLQILKRLKTRLEDLSGCLEEFQEDNPCLKNHLFEE